MANGTSVARRAEPKVMDLESAQASKRFLDAYNGKLGQLTPDQQAMFLMALGEKLGVKAELGELMLYQGKPYITLAGRIRLAHASGLLMGMEPRPATARERGDYGCGEGEQLWVCDAYRRGSPRAFRGWGHVSAQDRNPVSKTFPREMAKKRAKYDALAMAFPPAEDVTELHQRYIEEAEQEIQSQRVQSHPLISATYADEDASPEDFAGHDAAAEVETGEPQSPANGELPLQDQAKKPNRNAQLD